MTLSPAQTLEDLRHASAAAWLWDGARGRIVWANAAGISAFDSQTVFDLIDRPFDLKEPGIERIAELTQSLQRGESENALLHFPSTGQAVPLDCRCTLHALADGRSGLLVVARGAHIKPSDLPDQVFVAAFSQLPMAAAFLSDTGHITDANALASDLFAADTLASLLENEDRAVKLLARLKNSALVSSVEPIKGRIGSREVRLTLKRMGSLEKPFAMIMLDDITERRAAEREMAGIADPAKPSLAATDAQNFESLARTLKAAITHDDVQTKIEPRKPVVPEPNPSDIPFIISNALEQTGAAIAIVQDSIGAFVSKKTANLLGFADAPALMKNGSFWTQLLQLKNSNSSTKLKGGDGHELEFHIEKSSIPWVGGPAQQFVLHLIPGQAKVETAIEASVPPLPVVIATTQNDNSFTLTPADEELKSILDIASDGIITLDVDGKIMSFSAGAEAIFGYRTAEVLEKPLEDLLSAESRTSLRDYLSGLEQRGLASVFNDGREVTATVKQGGLVPLFLTIGRLQSPKSKAVFCAVVRDITTWKRTEKELREAKDTAEEASRQKSDFLARISHELRTPLNAIMGFSEVMRLQQFGEIKNEKYRGYVNDIHNSGGYLLALINDLLDLSKIEAGKMELNFTAVSIADVTDHATRLLQEVATRGRVLVRKSFPETLPRVVADLRAMRQVMINLLSNAIKFTDPGGQVIISAAVAKTGEMTLRIKDTGIGMNSEQQREALEPFRRVETAGRLTQGTGLGLPLTRALVEANRAKFDLSSEPGQGTLIEIIFPTTRVLAE